MTPFHLIKRAIVSDTRRTTRQVDPQALDFALKIQFFTFAVLATAVVVGAIVSKLLC